MFLVNSSNQLSRGHSQNSRGEQSRKQELNCYTDAEQIQKKSSGSVPASGGSRNQRLAKAHT